VELYERKGGAVRTNVGKQESKGHGDVEYGHGKESAEIVYSFRKTAGWNHKEKEGGSGGKGNTWLKEKVRVRRFK